MLKPEDYARLKALGLGRGVDATDPTPWRNKGSFRVREQIDENTVIGTDEGGLCRSYVEEVSSVLSQQAKLNASITVPKCPVDISIDAEYSRNFQETKKAEGAKVVTRTISFLSDFEDVVLREYNACSPGNAPNPTPLGFEKRLSDWLLEQLQQKEKYKDETLQSLLEKSACNSDDGTEVKELIKAACTDFVACFSVTHYVSTVHLGAVKYKVVCTGEDISDASIDASLGVKKIAHAGFNSSRKWKKLLKSTDLMTIGVLTDVGQPNEPRMIVHWRTEAEAVVGVKVQPISNLVRQPTLHTILREVLQKYMKDRGQINRKSWAQCVG